MQDDDEELDVREREHGTDGEDDDVGLNARTHSWTTAQGDGVELDVRRCRRTHTRAQRHCAG